MTALAIITAGTMTEREVAFMLRANMDEVRRENIQREQGPWLVRQRVRLAEIRLARKWKESGVGENLSALLSEQYVNDATSHIEGVAGGDGRWKKRPAEEKVCKGLRELGEDWGAPDELQRSVPVVRQRSDVHEESAALSSAATFEDSLLEFLSDYHSVHLSKLKPAYLQERRDFMSSAFSSWRSSIGRNIGKTVTDN
eukprot:CAMPEP_0119125364 /NCGR_PEP_ID=MMETSP1310-20130426/4667_1 /TAXON_ID=464262 /ORGANISM="Genus nov. species nov., Strain RCC2339" /LENGTH=197 /DNA_ID=CAMNT_0007115425 /DNA_START=402 /DNA_END=995 /DNA_ORIENTATION=+